MTSIYQGTVAKHPFLHYRKETCDVGASHHDCIAGSQLRVHACARSAGQPLGSSENPSPATTVLRKADGALVLMTTPVTILIRHNRDICWKVHSLL